MNGDFKHDNLSSMIGQLVGKMSGIHDDVKESKADIKTLLKFEAKTEERLDQGNRKFEDHENRLKKVERTPILEKVEKIITDKINGKINRIKKLPRAGIVYSILVVGLMVVSFVVVLAAK